MEIREGTRISKYELRRFLDRGGMGDVWEAFDLKAKRVVAIKFISPEMARDPDAYRRFVIEGESAAALNHPHVATIYDFEPEGLTPYIAMELMPGSDLRRRIAPGPLPIEEAIAMARDVAAGLAKAHARGVAHRDIKPENLMFDEDGRIKITDFGLARISARSSLTRTGTSLGSPGYMSPEAINGEDVGPPADVFALGIVLFEMITRKSPYPGEQPLAVMFAIANSDPALLRSACPAAPEALEALVSRMLQRAPESRPDASTVARELGAMTGMSAQSVDHLIESPEPQPFPGGLRAVAAFLVLALIAGGAYWIARSQDLARQRQREAVELNNRALAAIGRGDLAEGRRWVDAALGKDPHYGRALVNRAELYTRANELDSASAIYVGLLRSHAPDTALMAMVNYNIADLDFRTGAPDQAAAHLARSLSLDSSSVATYSNLGYALVLANRPPEALAVLTRGIARFPGAAPLYKNAALALIAMDREGEALTDLDRALSRDGTLTAARGWRARLRARGGDRSGALEDWKVFSTAEPPPEDAERAEVEMELRERGILPRGDR